VCRLNSALAFTITSVNSKLPTSEFAVTSVTHDCDEHHNLILASAGAALKGHSRGCSHLIRWCGLSVRIDSRPSSAKDQNSTLKLRYGSSDDLLASYGTCWHRHADPDASGSQVASSEAVTESNKRLGGVSGKALGG
jgi:hypothetical protein